MSKTEAVKECGHLVSYRMKLKILSPVFVGGGEESELNKLEYILDKKNRKILVLDENKWSQFLNQSRLLEDYMNHIILLSKVQKSRKGERPPQFRGAVAEWLQRKNIPMNRIQQCVKYSVKTDLYKPHDLKCFIKDKDMKPYIPGSSIKGAIRTALLHYIVKGSPDIKKYFWENQKNGEIDTEYLEEFVFNQIKRLEEINSDIMNAIQVSDSNPIENDNLIVLQKHDYTLKNGGKVNPLTLYREYLKPGSETNFNLTIDTSMLSGSKLESYVNSYQSLNTSIASYPGFLYGYEKKFHDKFRQKVVFPDKSLANLSLGGGSGFISKTIIHALAPDETEAKNKIKNILQRKFPKHNHKGADQYFSPRTLKLAKYNNQYHLIGWCHIGVDE